MATPTYPVPKIYAPLTQVTTANVKATGGIVQSALITNANAALRYFQIFNKATAPAGGDVPLYSIPVPAGTSTFPGTIVLDEVFFTRAGSFLSTGIGWAISTTFATFTDSATAADHVVVIHYN